jgi:hypothetical protein
MKTEADVQVKFGAFLEQYLISADQELIVHAEMPIYANHRARADLTIHRVPYGTVWTSRQQILESLVSVIEIKLANVRQPLFDFDRGGIKKDLELLKGLPPRIYRYLVIVDEAESIDPERVKDFLSHAKASQIIILSNNIALMGNA